MNSCCCCGIRQLLLLLGCIANSAAKLDIIVAFMIGSLLVSSQTLAVEISLSGTWYDQDKYHIAASDPQGGISWHQNYGSDSPHDPGEEVFEFESSIYNVPLPDNSCWIASAANMVRYRTGEKYYESWAYTDGVSGTFLNPWDGEVYGTWTFDDGGLQHYCFDAAGFDYAVMAKNSSHYDWVDPLEYIAACLNSDNPVGIGYWWGNSGHAITIYGIDIENGTMTVADSDQDYSGQGTKTHEITFEISSDSITLSNPYYDGATSSGELRYICSFDDVGWWTAGTGNWNSADNWVSGHAPTTSQDVYLTQSNIGSVTINSSANAKNLYVGNSATVLLESGGALVATEEYIGQSGTVCFYHSGGSNTLSGDLYLGCDADATCTYAISGNALLSADDEYVGYKGLGTITQTGGTNTVDARLLLGYESGSEGQYTISGSGRLSADDIYVGYYGDGTLRIESGGTVSNEGNSYIGYESGSIGTVAVDGTGSTWTSEYLLIGCSGIGTLSITGGATVSSAGGYVGFGSGSMGVVTVDGAGSTWTNSGSLCVGLYGNGTLDITDGATVTHSGNSVIGDASGSTGEVTVDGTDSTWTNSGSLYVGLCGSGVLKITDGASVSNSYGYLAEMSGSTGVATVDGTDSTWTNSGNLLVGCQGTGTLNITSGAAVSNSIGRIGNQSRSTGEVTVDGTGSTWTNSDDLSVGFWGSGTLNITNSAAVSDIYGYIGDQSGSTGEVTVDGFDSRWINTSRLYVGNAGNGKLSITNGGIGFGGYFVYIGTNSGSTGKATIDGSGSEFGSALDLHVGYNGNGELSVSNGAEGSSTYLYIGYGSGSTGKVTVDGTGSMLTASYALYVGNSGNGTLSITNGATVRSSNSYIGDETGSTGMVTLDGIDSTWTNSGGLYVGNAGNGILSITNGASVSNSEVAYIGYESGSTGKVTVDGVGSTWTNNGWLQIGRWDSSGTLNITNGATVSNSYGFIGGSPDQVCAVTVDGAGSTWTNTADLHIGDEEGSGTLNILHGATVVVGGSTSVDEEDSVDVINFGADGGTLTTGSLIASSAQLAGKGTINARGLVSDVDLVFDSTASLKQTITFNDQPDQNVTIHLDVSDNSGSNGALGAGYRDNGSLIISDGVSINSALGYIGYESGSTGEVTVDGIGSAWTNDGELLVGFFGNGTLNITNGATVSASIVEVGYENGSTGVVIVNGARSRLTNDGGLRVGGYTDAKGMLSITNGGAVDNSSGSIGGWSGSTGEVTVDGAGSTWTNSDDLYVGYVGSGTLSITGGGAVKALNVSINAESLLAIDVSANSLLDIDDGNGEIANDGTVRVLAGADATTGCVYSPISAGTWSGSGVYQAVGGTWDDSTHQFTVSSVESGTSGTATTLDLASGQRVMITDAGTGWSVGVSFVATDESTTLDFTATAVDGAARAVLQMLLAADESILSGWTFELTGDGYTEGDPAYLSFDVGAGFSREALNLWHYDETEGWTEYATSDLTYDGQYASFTVTGFSGYAVSAVPEPDTVVLLLVAMACCLFVARRKAAKS